MEQIKGRMGTATKIEVEPKTAAQYGALASWLLHLPDQHPAWDDYQISAVHLRDLAGAPPAAKQYEEAAYEIIMYALDPERKPRADVIDSLMPLRPFNYVVQFHGVTDEKVVEACRAMAERFVEGMLFAEPQGIRGAEELFIGLLEKALGLPGASILRRVS